MKKTKLIIGFVLVFLLGALSGAVGSGYLYHKRVKRFAGFDPAHRAEFFIKRLSKRLDLDQEQRANIKNIMLEMHGAIGGIRSKLMPEIQGIMDKAASHIKSELTTEQGRIADRMFERMKKHMRMRLQSHARPAT